MGIADSNRAKAFSAALALMTLVALALPLAVPAAANHGNRTLEIGHCSTQPMEGQTCPDSVADLKMQEVDSNAVGSLHTIRAVLSSLADSGSGPINIDFEIEGGPGDPGGDGNNPIPPDLTCTVPQGSSSCEVQYSSSETGTNSIRAWIDHDDNDNQTVNDPYDPTETRNSNDTLLCDPTAPPDPDGEECEGPLNNNDPGEIPEPDGTDVIEKTWTVGPPAILDCGPETATNPSFGTGSSEEYTCTVTDDFGNPIGGVQIDGENLAGANDPDNSATNSPPDYNDFCTTGSDGTCSSNVEIGRAHV